MVPPGPERTDAMSSKTKKPSLIKSEGSAFTDAINAATVEDLEKVLQFKGLSAKRRTRIEAALANKRKAEGKSADAPAAEVPPETAHVGPRAKKSAQVDKKRPTRPASGISGNTARRHW